jgi:hypothetical protein
MLEPNQYGVCYLCGKPLVGDLDDDHVPPRHLYAPVLRKLHNPTNLLTIRTHKVCNHSFQMDEEYFVHTMAPLAHDSYTGKALFEDLIRKYREGQRLKLGIRVSQEFDPRPGGLYLPKGHVLKRYDPHRIGRVTWKILRGLFFHCEGQFLPEDTPRRLRIIPFGEPIPQDAFILANHQTLGDCPGVFAYRYGRFTEAQGIYRYVWSLGFWDRIIILAEFHEPGCNCTKCRDARSALCASTKTR